MHILGLWLASTICLTTTYSFASPSEDALRQEVILLREAVAMLKKEVDVLKQSQTSKMSTKPITKKSKGVDLSTPRHTAKVSSDEAAAEKVAVVPVHTTVQKETPSTEKFNGKEGMIVPKYAPVPLSTHFLSWTNADISALIAGGASTGYSKQGSTNGSFNIVDLNPLLLFSYKDFLLLTGSVDFSLDERGDTQTSLDFLNMNLVLNDYVIFGVGKFDSALGQFVRNLSPSWINRLPDSPVGFGGDEAAPQSDIGVQLRGGFPTPHGTAANYVVFVSNGPQAFVDQTTKSIDHIGTDGFTQNNGNCVFGGRFGFLPIANMEIGVSAAIGKLSLIDFANNTTLLQKGRNYNVLGADAVYKWKDLTLRTEYIQQQVSSQLTSLVSPQGGTWKAWYVQASYMIPSTKWEPVLRYGTYNAPGSANNRRQLAFGLNYRFAPSIAIQAAYEINHGQYGSDNNRNNFLIQFVFGF